MGEKELRKKKQDYSSEERDLLHSPGLHMSLHFTGKVLRPHGRWQTEDCECIHFFSPVSGCKTAHLIFVHVTQSSCYLTTHGWKLSSKKLHDEISQRQMYPPEGTVLRSSSPLSLTLFYLRSFARHMVPENWVLRWGNPPVLPTSCLESRAGVIHHSLSIDERLKLCSSITLS